MAELEGVITPRKELSEDAEQQQTDPKEENMPNLVFVYTTEHGWDFGKIYHAKPSDNCSTILHHAAFAHCWDSFFFFWGGGGRGSKKKRFV